MQLTDKNGNVYGWNGLEIIGPDGKPKTIDQGLTSVGLSMPSAFTVSNSPLTSNGTIGVTGAGTTSQYIDGTGALRTFPSLSGYVTAVTASAPLSSSGGTTPNITISQASGTDNGYLSSTDWLTFNNKQPAGNYITALSGEATGSGPGTASVTLNNASVTAKVLTGVNITGGSISASDSILTAFGKLQNQINGLIGSAVYQGTWNASTNNPTLASGVGTRGYYYIVNVAGSTNLDGITDWNVGDWAIFDGTAWQQVDNTDSVTSVNGQTGAVSLTTDNIPEGAVNQYFTQLRARQSLTLSTTGNSGAATYNNTTGVLNIPIYTDQFVGTVTSVDMSVPTGFTISGNPITSAGTLALGFNSDYSLPTIASQLEWDQAYDDMIVSASVTGTTTKTLTLNQQDGGTITASWTDYDTAPVTSVFGRTGAVVAQSGDYTTTLVPEGTNLYYTDARSRAAISLTTTGSSGAATYNSGTGVLNIPDYSTALGGYVPTSRRLEINGISYDLTTDRSWSVGTVTSVAMTVPTGLTVSGTPITNSGTLAIGLQSGYSIPTTTNQSNWTTAYNRSIVSAAVTYGTNTNLVLTQQNTGTITTSLVAGTASQGKFVFFNGSNLAYTSIAATAPLSLEPNNFTFSIAQATTSTDGYLSSTDWNTFNSKQNAITLTTTGTSGPATLIGSTLNIPQYQDVITNPVTGTGAANYVARWTSSSNISTGVLYDNGTNVGINTTAPGKTLDVFGDVRFQSANSRLDFTVAYNGLGDLPAGILLSTWATANNNLAIIPSAQGTAGSKVVLGAYNGSVWRSMVEFANTSGEPNLLLVKSAGNVGIGTSSPVSVGTGITTLDIQGSAAGGIAIGPSGIKNYIYGASTLYIEANTTASFYTNGAERMRITAGGNLLVGTTSAGANGLLQVNGSIGLGQNTEVRQSTNSDGGTLRFLGTQFVAGITNSHSYNYSGGALIASVASSDNAILLDVGRSVSTDARFKISNTISGNATLFFGTSSVTSLYANTATGYVGIGTTSPAVKLHVAGTTETSIRVSDSGGAYLELYQQATDSYFLASNALAFYNGGSERMRITSGGNVGIGTSTPGYKLEVNGSVYGSTTAQFGTGYIDGTQSGWAIFGSNSMSNGIKIVLDGNVSRNDIVVSTSANVGIGTASPGYKLDINGTSRSDIHIFRSNQSAPTADSFIFRPADNTVALGTANAERMRIDASGNVGIGVTPSASWATSFRAIQMTGGVALVSHPTLPITYLGANYLATDAGARYIQTDGAARFLVNGYSGGFSWDIAPSGTAGNAISFTQAMTLDASGRLGIGTTSPQQKLHVVGDEGQPATSGTTQNGIFRVDPASTEGWGETLDMGMHIGVSGPPSYAWLQATNKGNHGINYNLALNPNGGNVGIGTTSPSEKLHVAGNLRVTGAIVDSNNSAGTSGQVLSSTGSGTDWVSLSEITGVDGTGTANYVAKWQDANTIQNSLIYDNGTNVGVGTTNPKTKFDVNGDIGFGSKGMSISDVFADALTVNMNDHTGCYVKITAFGDWGYHSTIAYVAEFFLQASAGGFNEPGLIIRQVDNTANDDIQAQILDPVGTGTRNFVIQLKSTSSSYTPFNAYIQYEVRGLYNSVS
jgi:hypothetical protein